MNQPATVDEPLVIRRHLNASPERVFQAWTQVDQLRQWFGPSDDYAIPILEADVRVGGRYRIGFQQEGGELNIVTGEYRVVDPPVRLSFTWTWAEPNPIAGAQTLVTIELLVAGDGTDLVLTHERFPDVESRDHHSVGWNRCFDRLQKIVE